MEHRNFELEDVQIKFQSIFMQNWAKCKTGHLENFFFLLVTWIKWMSYFYRRKVYVTDTKSVTLPVKEFYATI